MSKKTLSDKLEPLTIEEIQQTGIYSKWISVSLAAKQRRVAKTTILNMIHRGTLRAKTIYGLIVVDKSQL